MGYPDATITSPATGRRLLAKPGSGQVEISTQSGMEDGGRMVYLRIAESGRKAVYEIPLEEWSRLNRDATKTP